MKKNSNPSEKMILVNGMLVPQSKVEGRLKALARGRQIAAAKNASLHASKAEEVWKLREEGYSESEITQKFAQEDAETALSHGFIKPTRIKKSTKPQYGNGLMFH